MGAYSSSRNISIKVQRPGSLSKKFFYKKLHRRPKREVLVRLFQKLVGLRGKAPIRAPSSLLDGKQSAKSYPFAARPQTKRKKASHELMVHGVQTRPRMSVVKFA